MSKVSVDAKALREVLQALVGPSYLINELQVLRRLGNSPIDKLIEEYNAQTDKPSNPSSEAKDLPYTAHQMLVMQDSLSKARRLLLCGFGVTITDPPQSNSFVVSVSNGEEFSFPYEVTPQLLVEEVKKGEQTEIPYGKKEA